jgi:hypothetical protein
VGYTYRVEKKRPNKSVGFFAYARVNRADGRGFSPIFITAALSVLILLAVAGWEMNQSLQAKNAPPVPAPVSAQDVPAALADTADAASTSSAATSSDPISDIGTTVLNQLEGAYTQMQEAGVYSTTTAQEAGESLAPYVTASVSYPTFSSGDIKTDPDTSYARMLTYRNDLRTSLAPLLKNTEPEYEIFAYYTDTKDASYLTKLKDVAQNYRDAANLTANVSVPADAVPYHIAILDAMEEFAATLDAMAAHASDPFASVALLRSYDQAESDMLTSFNALTTYYKSKTP